MMSLRQLKWFRHNNVKATVIEKNLLLEEKMSETIEKGQQKAKWVHVITDDTSMSLQELKEPVNNRYSWQNYVNEVTKNQK